ncbi:Pentatricopeptide repeat-containing protein [Platanthera zijinensis]|uniref:Pentatricopeptide repeat-containing protein n=1 Tax=Platanthera zijinensis TaxID=2320716 RepID=A0AAP0BBH8_9ASPA
MISGYARHGEVALARKLFDEMPLRDVISWNCMLSGYVMSYDLGELMEARRLFDQMPARDVISWNTMISGYTRNGKMVEAMQLFGGMPERNVISWNTVLTGFLRVGDVKSALELFGMMPIQDSTSLNALVSGLIQNNLLGEATKILLRSIKEASEMEGAVDSFNTLIVGYGRVGRVKEARKLFDEMPERDLVSWNTMIAGYVQALKMDEAVLLFQSVDKPDTRSWNTMICGFAQMGDVGKARSLFDQLPHKGLVSWNTMISGYEQNGDFEGAIRLFSEMLSAGERFDRHTMSSLLSACAGLASLRQGAQIHQLIMKTIVPDAPISNSLITMYSRCGSITEAENVFDSMEAQRNVISWNSMIAGYANHGDLGSVRKVFDEMPNRDTVSWNVLISSYTSNSRTKDALLLFDAMQSPEFGSEPDAVTCMILLQACANLGALDFGERIHNYVDNHGYGNLLKIKNSLVTMYSKCGSMDRAYRVFSDMPERNVVTWSTMISGLAMNGYGREAIDAFEEMRRDGVLPDEQTFTGILSACSHTGLVDEGIEFFDVMRFEYGISPNVCHYGCLVDLFGRAGFLDRAYRLIVGEMIVQPDAKIWRTLLGTCRIHKYVELGERVIEHLIELKSQQAGDYVLLLNIYASVGDWEKVADVRRVMKEQNIQTSSGCTTMEINGKIHEFVADDDSHPSKEEIYVMLDEVGRQLKIAGYVANMASELHDLDAGEKEGALSYHSEKIALAFGILATVPGKTLRIAKNLRMCVDCHYFTKVLSSVYDRVVIVRDRSRFHHFRNGRCSCNDYW